MLQPERPPHSSPPSTLHHDVSPDNSWSTSDRSLRSMHSAPSLPSTLPSTASLNHNVHLIPLPHSHLHIRSEADSITYSDESYYKSAESNPDALMSKHTSKEMEDTVQIPVSMPNITITPSVERLQLRRMKSERSVASSLHHSRSNESFNPQAHSSWRVSEYGVLSHPDDDNGSVTEESISGSTDELRHTLFYRPSTDPTDTEQSRSHAEPDAELQAVLSANATSSTNLVSASPDRSLLQPPARPPRPPSLNLSDTEELKPKSVDLVRPGTKHSRMRSRERLSVLLGMKSSPPLQDSRPSLGAAHSRSESGGTVHDEGVTEIGVLTSSQSKYVPEPGPSTSSLSQAPGERTVQVHQVNTIGSIGLARARTISGGSFADVSRSVWEDDDSEESAKGWGLVKRWLGDDESKASTVGSGPSKKPKPKRHVPKALSLASTVTAFRTPPTTPSLRNVTLPSSSSVAGASRPSASVSASFRTANASFYTTTASSRPSFHSLSTHRQSFQSRQSAQSNTATESQGPHASDQSSLASVVEPESPTMTAARMQDSSRSESEDRTETPRLLLVPRPVSKVMFAEPEPRKYTPADPDPPMLPAPALAALPSPPSSPSPRAITTTARSLHNPTYPSLHRRIGSLVNSGSGPSPLYAAVPPSPLRSPSSPGRSIASSSPLWSPLYPPNSPGPLGMDSTYRSDVRPISGITESSFGRGSGVGTYGRPDSSAIGQRDSGGTWAGRASTSHRPLLLVPPQARTVRIVEVEREGREKGKGRENDGLPTPPPSASKVGTLFKVGSGSTRSRRRGPKVKRRADVEYEGGMSPGKWFALGFVLGPWCWMIGGWMMSGQGRSRVVGDAEKGVHEEGEQWIRRCRIAAVVSGVVVFGGALAAVLYAVLATR